MSKSIQDQLESNRSRIPKLMDDELRNLQRAEGLSTSERVDSDMDRELDIYIRGEVAKIFRTIVDAKSGKKKEDSKALDYVIQGVIASMAAACTYMLTKTCTNSDKGAKFRL